MKLCYRIGDSLFKLDADSLLEMNEWAFAYADDLVLLSDEKEKLQESLQIFDKAVADAGMEMSVAKTKVMQTGKGAGKDDISLDFGARGTVKEVKEFKYLGSLITNDGSMTREISERIVKAGGVFARMRRNVFAVRAMAKSVKMRVYAASVLSVLLYGSETWNITVADIRRLESFHNRCLRCMFGISRLTHFTNFDLRKLTGQQSIGTMIMNNRLRWLGHIVRMADERMPKRMLFGKLQTARPQGGAKQRWKDCLLADLRFMGLENGWTQVATQRDKWHARTREAVTKWESEKNRKEKEVYEEKKAGLTVACPRCHRMFLNEKGMKGHFGQIHKGVETSSDEEGDDDDDDDDDDKDTATSSTKSKSRSSSSRSSNTKEPSKYVCPNEKCKKDCSTGAGLARHLRCNEECEAVAEASTKKKEKEKRKK